MQELVRGEFWLKISIGGREIFAVKNQMPTEFTNVKVNFFFVFENIARMLSDTLTM